MHRPLAASDFPSAESLRRLGRQVHCLKTIDSTNVYLLSDPSRFPDGTLATAEFQTAGRGRLGRTWQAPRGSSVLLSVLLHEPADSPLITLGATVAGFATCEAIELATGLRSAIRWPNDIVLGERKVAGVLAESTMLADGRRALVLGMGINCLQHRGHFPPALTAFATSLEIESPNAIDRPAVARALLTRLDARLTSVRNNATPADLQLDWQAWCNDRGKPVTLRTRAGLQHGTILDIDATGGLLVQLASGERCVFEAATTTRIWEPA